MNGGKERKRDEEITMQKKITLTFSLEERKKERKKEERKKVIIYLFTY